MIYFFFSAAISGVEHSSYSRFRKVELKDAALEVKVGSSIASCVGFLAQLVPTGQGDGLLGCGCKLPRTVCVAPQVCWQLVLAAVVIGVLETTCTEMWTPGVTASRSPPF